MASRSSSPAPSMGSNYTVRGRSPAPSSRAQSSARNSPIDDERRSRSPSRTTSRGINHTLFGDGSTAPPSRAQSVASNYSIVNAFEKKCETVVRLTARIGQLKKRRDEAKKAWQAEREHLQREVEMVVNLRKRANALMEGEMAKVRDENESLKEKLSKAESDLATAFSEVQEREALTVGLDRDNASDDVLGNALPIADDILADPASSPWLFERPQAPFGRTQSPLKRVHPWAAHSSVGAPKRAKTGGDAVYMRHLPDYLANPARPFTSLSGMGTSINDWRCVSRASSFRASMRSERGDRLFLPDYFKAIIAKYPKKRNWMIKIFNSVRINSGAVSADRFKEIFIGELKNNWIGEEPYFD